MSDDPSSNRPMEGEETLPAGRGLETGSSSGSLDGGRFTPGTMIDARYRIVGLLGRGGMGEVYLAEDLKLGERVALKFLPEGLTRDGAALARFHSEVRTARLITHKNVVRVHDLGEVDGQPFLSMEYVEGEDLKSLLRRIGRLPQAKATDLARQLAAGLAAAHERGVLHRDLKPANVMIDSDGQAKISDFGLAEIASELAGAEIAGTPAYMAPEQLERGEASFAGDLFSLGLVLHEMFSGRPAFQASSRAELLERHRTGRLEDLPSQVQGLDPAVERVVERCLSYDPADRPASALDVAAALPGGDPIAAALAAGETPSPEMVARARVAGALPPWLGLALLGTLVLAVLGTAWLRDRTATPNLLELPRPPAVLEDRALSLAAELGHDLEGRFRYRGLEEDRDYFAWVRRELPRSRWTAVAARSSPPLVAFWLVAATEAVDTPFPRWWHFEDLRPGDLKILLDPEGRLLELGSRPAERAIAASPGTATVDWTTVFEAAGLDLNHFEPVEPRRLPDRFVDERRAWLGVHPRETSVELRVEAAAYGGRLVELGLFPGWRNVTGEETAAPGISAALRIFLALVIPTSVLISLYLVRRNLKSGRGDRRGAFRLSAFVLTALSLGWLLGARHVGPPTEQLGRFFSETGDNLLVAALFWLIYIALEPTLRKRWPAGLISWTRLLSGRLRDPLLGRDVLIGAAAASVTCLLIRAANAAQGASLGGGDWIFALEGRHGTAIALFQMLVYIPMANAFLALLLFTLAWLILRRRPLAAAAVFLFFLAQMVFVFGARTPIGFAAGAAFALAVALVVSRAGVTAIVAFWFVFFVMMPFPGLSLDFSTWYAGATFLAWALLLGIGLYGYRVATAGRPLFREPD